MRRCSGLLIGRGRVAADVSLLRGFGATMLMRLVVTTENMHRIPNPSDDHQRD